jgi:two-component sensor histidine kinase
MSEVPWARRQPPEAGSDVPARWRGEVDSAAELTGLRRQLRAALRNGSLPAGDDNAVESLLLAFEELASNGLRHGEAPVSVMVTADGSGWLLEVSDAAVDRPPTPAIGRDAAAGGLGLHLVTQLAAAHGWAVTAGRKHVWCRILYTRPRAAPA